LKTDPGTWRNPEEPTEMILYHFTPLRTLFGGEPLTEEDMTITLTELAPFPSDDYPEMPPVAWLTADPNPGGPAEECSFVRLKLTIPSTDRRLYPWKTFIRKHWHRQEPGISKAEIEARLRTLPDRRGFSFWVYEGAILQSRWNGIETVRGQQVWWGSLGGYQIGLGPAQAAAE
jgi:hypothetical protein